jgi:hypothetical protein
MHLTSIQKKFFQDVETAVLDLGGMLTKYHAFPLTMQTKAGILRTRASFDGIECQFDEPSRATALGIPSHRMKGTWKFDLPLGSQNDVAACSALIARFQNEIKPL